jgi:hypothetical protein
MGYRLLTPPCIHSLRPPDWRWRLARRLVDHPDDPDALAQADRWVTQAVPLARELRRGPAPAVPRADAVGTAHDVYAGQDQLGRSVLEAHLLAGEPLDRVAASCGLRRDVVAVYGQIFFHARDALGGSSYVVHRVLGPQLSHGLTEDDVGALLMVAALDGAGPRIDLVARYLRRPATADEDIDVGDPDAVCDYAARVQARAWVADRTLPADRLGPGVLSFLDGARRLLDPPAGGQEVSGPALVARLRIVCRALDAVGEHVASAGAQAKAFDASA